MARPVRALSLALLASAASARLCQWGPQNLTIPPWNQGWSFCCPGLSGTVKQAAQATYIDNPLVPAAGPDDYSIRPGITGDQKADHCESNMRDWYDETFHKDVNIHTLKGAYGPANFQLETLALVFWCHNKGPPCRIEIQSVTIGTDEDDDMVNGTSTGHARGGLKFLVRR